MSFNLPATTSKNMTVLPTSSPSTTCANVTASSVYVDKHQAFIAINAALLSFGLAFSLVCLLAWLWKKNKYERTRIRPTILIFMGFAGTIAAVLVNHLGSVLSSPLPCSVDTILVVMAVPLLFGSLISKLMIFFFLSKFSHESATVALASLNENGFAFLVLGSQQRKTGTTSCTTSCAAIGLSFKLLFCPQRKTSEDMENTVEVTQQIDGRQIFVNEYKAQLREALAFMVSNWGVLTLCFLFTLPYALIAIVIVSTNPETAACEYCDYLRYVTLNTVIAESAFLLLLGIFVWIRGRKFEDPWGLREECFWSLLAFIVTILFFLLDLFIGLWGQSLFQFWYLETLFILAVLAISTLLQLYQGHRQTRLTRASTIQIDVKSATSSTSSSYGLDEILADPRMTEAFERHLTNELGLESLLFLRDAKRWKLTYYDIAPTARRSRAKKIQNTYLDLSGTYAVNVSDDVSRNILRTLQETEGDVPITIFDTALDEVKKLMATGSVMRFVHSQAFQNLSQSSPNPSSSVVLV
jgi:hypothetical protein